MKLELSRNLIEFSCTVKITLYTIWKYLIYAKTAYTIDVNKFVCLEATVSQQEGGMVEFQKQGQPLQNWRRYGTPTTSARKKTI